MRSNQKHPTGRIAAGAPRHAVLVLMFITFLAFYAGMTADAHIKLFVDSREYMDIANGPLDGAHLLRRPPLYPLLIKILAHNVKLLAACQTLAYIAAWTFLAITVYHALPRNRQPLGVALVFYVALYPDFAAWNHLILTESFSISALVAAFALLTRMLCGAGGLWAYALMAVICIGLRDTNIFVTAALCIPLPLLAWGGLLRWRAALAAGAVIAAGAAASLWSVHAQLGDADQMRARWVVPMLNVLAQRILPVARARDFFVQHGMPPSRALDSLSGTSSTGGNFAFFQAPELAQFRAWFVQDRQSTYMSLLLHHPGFALRPMACDMKTIFNLGAWGRLGTLYPDPQFAPMVWKRLPLIWAYLSVPVAAVILLRRAVRARQRVLLANALALCGVYLALPALACVIYCGDSNEIERHELPVSVIAALTSVVTITIALQSHLAAPAPQKAD